MNRLILVAVLCLSSIGWTWTGGWQSDITAGIDFYTVATLPASPSANDVAGVTDGADAADCTVGGGTDFNICIYTGAAWVIVGDGTAAASSGDSITVGGVAIDTTANFVDDGIVDFTITDGGAGGPDAIKGDIDNDSIDSQHYAADSIDNEHINWADIDNLGDEGAVTLASTATALAADPANCASSGLAGGINAFGVAEACIVQNAGTDITADLEEETHASEHAVSAADTVFPADPGADRYLMWDDDPGQLTWAEGGGGGVGDVTSVGDCTDGACLDGTDDGGTNILFYDADGATTLQGGNTTGAVTLTLPTTTGTLIYSGGAFHDGFSDFVANEHIDWTGASAGTIHASNYVDNNTTYTAGTNLTLSTTTFNVDDAFVINSGNDTMAGVLTADGLTLGQDENITLGAQTLDHDGTNFVFNDSVSVSSGSSSSVVFGTGYTSDPCGTLGEGALFYNTTSNYLCYCDGTNDLKLTDNTTACF